jgi:hypothetical protein
MLIYADGIRPENEDIVWISDMMEKVKQVSRDLQFVAVDFDRYRFVGISPYIGNACVGSSSTGEIRYAERGYYVVGGPRLKI